MHAHLAFVKLDHDGSGERSVSQLSATLTEALATWNAEVMPAADAHARAAWDLAIVVRGEKSDLDGVRSALTSALDGWPVGAVKGWSFGEGP